MSRPRSATSRGASSSAGTRAAGGRPGIFVQAPRSDIYVALLGIAVGAMVIGCILLVLILKRYDFKWKATAQTSPPSSALIAHVEKPDLFFSVRL